MFGKITIIGVGLIGGSLGGAIKKKGLAQRVIGCGRSISNLEIAKERRLIDDYEQNPLVAVKDADLVIIGTNLNTYPLILDKIKDGLKDGVILSEIGSVKVRVIDEFRRYVSKGFSFVPTHPIAGSEKQGAMFADPLLFDGRLCIITPYDGINVDDERKIEKMWKDIGSNVIRMSPEEHDRVLAYTSHFIHSIAYTISHLIGKKKNYADISGGALRDYLRIADSPPEMWKDIFLWNKDAIMKVFDEFLMELVEIKDLIGNGDEEKLLLWLKEAREAKKTILK